MTENDLERFIEAQEGRTDNPMISDYRTALNEIRAGVKVTHWIWYVFPQLRGLGRTEYARYYGLSGLEEAKAYLAHPVLGSRLREITDALLSVQGRTALDILGRLDERKVRACMTLFLQADSREQRFQAVLDRYYGGSPDSRTTELLGIN